MQILLKLTFLTLLLVFFTIAVSGQNTLLSRADFDRINQQAQQSAWAAQTRTDIINAAGNWAANYTTKYGISQSALPPEGGQWPLWYVCTTHGTKLQFTAPNRHACTVDNQAYTGWPYDQVIYTRRHEDLGAAALNNGLAFQLTGKENYAKAAAQILLGYADRYLTYPLHDANNKTGGTGARVMAQTLDEAIWLIDLAWAYDLIAASGVLNQEEKNHIANDFLRASIQTIQRVDGKENNWQSWHNAAIGAVGFATQDQALINQAIDGPSGFRFQMRQSVLGEGIWYEGSWGYHFYALDALVKLAEMAARNGIDLYAEPGLRRMFELPVRFSFADMTLPAFNDSAYVNLAGYNNLYEIAYARFNDPLFAITLTNSTRSRNALFWGAPNLPAAAPSNLKSEIFPNSGYAALRADANDHTILFKYGPHGGFHGHPDKLNFISYAKGSIQAVDPGTQSYAIASHNTWDKQTVAHNTIVVDEKSQDEATGKLLWSSLQGPMKAVRAEAGAAYKNVYCERTIYFTDDYAVDVLDAQATDGLEHNFDWVYHNYGQIRSDLPLADYFGFPQANGYEHLSNNRALYSSEEWKLDFDSAASLLGNYGVVYASTNTVKGTFQNSRDYASTGNFSGAITYDLTGPGYLLYSTPTLKNQPKAKPSSLWMMVYGDNSGNKLSVRINDATDERFVTTVGPINWSGWCLVQVFDPEKWTHYLGNNDGVMDTPVKSVSLQIDPVAGAPKTGKLYVDDITLIYPGNDRVIVADFERQLQNMRVWMQAAPGTMVVTGQGLGPDLLKPVPYVMARRKGTAAHFVTLLEPYSDAPRAYYFRETGKQSFQVIGTNFNDVFSINSDGTLSYLRRTRTSRR